MLLRRHGRDRFTLPLITLFMLVLVLGQAQGRAEPTDASPPAEELVALEAPEHAQMDGRHTPAQIEDALDLPSLWQAIALFLIVAALLTYRQLELTRLNRRLRAAKESAEVADKAKRAFLANMSHEVRTPLHAILSLAKLGLDTPDPARVHSYLQEIRRSGHALLAIVDDVLDLARIERGLVHAQTALFDLGDVLAQVRAVTLPLARDKGIDLDCRLPDELAGLWVGDPNRLVQILINLVGNGVKFTEQGKVTCTLSQVDSVSGKLSQAGEPGLAFRVSDTGVGMTEPDMEQLFASFHQIDSSITRRHGGVGLGLAIVRQLTELMGGRVSVKSRPGEGSEFVVTLPLHRQTGLERPAAPPPAPTLRLHQVLPPGIARTPDPQAPSRALVVEDTPISRDILVDMLAHLGVASDTAPNGVEALKRLLERPRDYGLVLMDIQMPEMDGREATERLRCESTIAHLPVVAVTAHALDEDREHCLAVGIDDYMIKPVDPMRLAAVIRHWLPDTQIRASGEPDPPRAPGQQPNSPEAEAGAMQSAHQWLDFDQGLAFCADDPELYDSVLGTFANGHGPTARLLASEGIGREEVRRIAHNLKGTAPMIGAMALGRVSASLDELLRSQDGAATQAPDPSRVRAMVNELHRTLTQTLDAVDARLHPAKDAVPEDARAKGEDTWPSARVLLVDDDPVNLHLLTEALAPAYDLVRASDGAAALELAGTGPRPDLILLDIGLPDMDGYEVCRRLKADPVTRDTPVVFVTGRVDPGNERKGLALGAVDYIHKPFNPDVVRARVQNHLALKRQSDALERLSSSDALTGIPNRRGFDHYLNEAWAKSATKHSSLALAMMDIDHFKSFNDHYGHAAGDTCLRRVGKVLQTLAQQRGGQVARYGGEEFAWVLPGSDATQAKAAAVATLSAVHDLHIAHAYSTCADHLTLSIGIWAQVPGPGDTPADLIAEADRRLYVAKRDGRNRIA